MLFGKLISNKTLLSWVWSDNSRFILQETNDPIHDLPESHAVFPDIYHEHIANIWTMYCSSRCFCWPSYPTS